MKFKFVTKIIFRGWIRDKASQLSKAEANIEKYQRRLEDLNILKKQVRVGRPGGSCRVFCIASSVCMTDVCLSVSVCSSIHRTRSWRGRWTSISIVLLSSRRPIGIS